MAGRGMLARSLFTAACAAALLLCAAVAAAPWLADGEARGWRRVLALFAQDAALRRTSLASAAGLVVTACVFFRPGPQRPPPRPRRGFGGGA
ncbi:MAG TPA: hypothetical protein VFE78_13070 [Gemmataceae bacterium]|nr:hypothetical protein [Gemmataceae bacterium]